jgi:FixJ family two-component response regulator
MEALRSLVATLTPREHEVFALVVRGKLNKQIAYVLGTSERTIKAHRHSIMQKLRIRSIAEAVSMAERLGILGPPAGDENA